MHVRVSNLGSRRGDVWLFRGLNLSMTAGEMCWLRGDNGRGKTTLLRLLARLAVPDEGEIVMGDVPTGADDETSPAPLYLAHANALNGDLSVEEALRFMALLHGRQADGPRVMRALQAVEMHQRRRQLVRTLSQGQRRRVALARLALESMPGLWLLDEPFDALDTRGVGVVNTLLEGHTARGGSVVLTSHIPVRLSNGPVREWALQTGGVQ